MTQVSTGRLSSLVARVGHLLRWLKTPQYRDLTPQESSLTAQIDRLTVSLADRDKEIRLLRDERDSLASKLKIAQVEVTGLTEVIVRDRKRVEAETASFAQQIAQASLATPRAH